MTVDILPHDRLPDNTERPAKEQIIRIPITLSQADGHSDTAFARQVVLDSVRLSIERQLCEVIEIIRDDDLALTQDERAHAKRWAATVVALMDQGNCRKASTAMLATVEAALQGVKQDAREANEDHSAWHAIEQAVDRVLNQLRTYNLPLAVLTALQKAVGVK